MNSETLAFEWKQIWNKVKEYSDVDSSQVNAFFPRLQPQAMSDDFLMLTADNEWLKNWIERHYSHYIKQALYELKGVDFTIAFEVNENQSNKQAPQVPETPVASIPSSPSVKEERYDERDVSKREEPEEEPHFQEYERKQENTNGTSTKFTFENFVIGDSNRDAYSVAVAVAEEPGKNLFNPLFIYGKSGLGKTHLLRAIQNYIAEKKPWLKTVYVDSSEFINKYMEASIAHDKNKESYKNFRTVYEEADVLLIDDVQYFQGKTSTLDIVFQIFNKLTAQGKQIVLSADRAPKNIDFDERVTSRFNEGATYSIFPPELETKMGIVKAFIDEYKAIEGINEIFVPQVVQEYIADISGSNVRELKSAVGKVIYRIGQIKPREITLDEVKEMLQNHFSSGALFKYTISDIQKTVENYYKISHADLIGKKRSRNIAYARHVAVYLSRQMLDLPYSYIGKSFGGRDHTTIMHSVTSMEERLKENRETREELDNIKQIIKEGQWTV